MDIIELSNVKVVSASPDRSRTPLSLVTNSPPRALTFLQHKRIRRTSSVIGRTESSEDVPSLHESIFQAERFSSTNSEDYDCGISSKATLDTAIALTSSINLAGRNENILDQLLAPTTRSTAILYGHGTTLRTIVEQKSSATMSTKVSSTYAELASEASLVGSSTLNLLGHRNSFDLPSTITLRSPHRRKSFSVDDLILIKRSYHEACTIIEKRSDDSSPLSAPYAEPHAPIISPIDRPKTPPGMPSGTAAQSRARPQQRSSEYVQNRLQRFQCIKPSPMEFPFRVPIPTTLRHGYGDERFSSNPLPRRVVPRFRPGRSGHWNGLLNSHPFYQNESADIKSNDVSVMLSAQRSNPPLSTRPHASQRTLRMASIGVESGHNNITQQCRHRRGRHTFLQTLHDNAEVAIQDPNRSAINYAPLVSNVSERNSSLQSVSPTKLIRPQATGATASPILKPLMTGTVALQPVTAIPSTNTKHETRQCWKCHVFKLVSKLDDMLESSTRWCCWMLCGVDLNDEVESQCYDDEVGAQRSYVQGSLGPRRVLSIGTPGLLF